MNEPEKKKEENDFGTAWSESRLTVFLQSTFYTIVFIAVFGGLGYWLDQQFDTKPMLFIVGLLIAFPATQIHLYRKMKNYAKDKVNKTKRK